MIIGTVDIIKSSLDFYAKNWKKLMVYLGLLLVPTAVLSSIGVISALLTTYTSSLASISAVIILAVFAAGIVFSLWVSIALMIVIKKILKNEPLEDWKKIVSDSSPFIWQALLTSIMTTLLVLLGSILFLIPGIIFAIWYTFTLYTVLFEGKKGREALKASKNLVVGRWWQIFIRVALPAIFFGLVSSIITGLLIWPTKYIGSEIILEMTQNFISTIINLALTPLVSVAVIILYFSAKENPVEKPEEKLQA